MSLSFPILKLVSEARNSHGLRLQDPVRYNAYCKKRISTLKRALKFIQKSKKAPPKPVTLELVQHDTRFLEVVLFSAERAWSQSTSLKSDEDQYTKRKHHISRRLKKAISHAEKLTSLLDSESLSVNATSRLEARAYKATLTGQSAFESKQWQSALTGYSTAKVILEVLLSKSDDNNRLVYKEALQAVDPGLRYCGYQLQLNTSQGDTFSLAQKYLPKDDNTIIDLLKGVNSSILDARRESSARAGITSIEWRGRNAPLRHPEIVVALLAVQDTQSSLSERTTTFDLSPTEKVAAMDEILNAWAEAQTEVQRLVDDEVTVKQDKEQNLQIILTYVSFHFIATRVQRDGLLVKELQKKSGSMTILKDLVRLHDSIIQSIKQIYELPGVAADSELTASLDAKQAYFKASRCILIARSHTLLKDDISALALYEKAQTYISKLPFTLSPIAQDIPVTKDDITSLARTLESETTRSHAQVIVSNTTTDSAPKNVLMTKLHQFPRSTSIDLANLVEYPLTLQPVPVKPYFFDIAYNYFGLEEQDMVEEKMEEVSPTSKKEEKKQEPLKKGWFWR